jgi:hypothetical protein
MDQLVSVSAPTDRETVGRVDKVPLDLSSAAEKGRSEAGENKGENKTEDKGEEEGREPREQRAFTNTITNANTNTLNMSNMSNTNRNMNISALTMDMGSFLQSNPRAFRSPTYSPDTHVDQSLRPSLFSQHPHPLHLTQSTNKEHIQENISVKRLQAQVQSKSSMQQQQQQSQSPDLLSLAAEPLTPPRLGLGFGFDMSGDSEEREKQKQKRGKREGAHMSHTLTHSNLQSSLSPLSSDSPKVSPCEFPEFTEVPLPFPGGDKVLDLLAGSVQRTHTSKNMHLSSSRARDSIPTYSSRTCIGIDGNNTRQANGSDLHVLVSPLGGEVLKPVTVADRTGHLLLHHEQEGGGGAGAGVRRRRSRRRGGGGGGGGGAEDEHDEEEDLDAGIVRLELELEICDLSLSLGTKNEVQFI